MSTIIAEPPPLDRSDTKLMTAKDLRAYKIAQETSKIY